MTRDNRPRKTGQPLFGVETPQVPRASVSEAIRTLAQGLAQLADALDAAGAVVPFGLAPIINGLTNGHHSNNWHNLEV